MVENYSAALSIFYTFLFAAVLIIKYNSVLLLIIKYNSLLLCAKTCNINLLLASLLHFKDQQSFFFLYCVLL